MKTPPSSGGPIWDAWLDGGAMVGPRRPDTRLTVQPDYQLHVAYTAGSYPKVPVRWFQRADNSQTEVEIPGVRSFQTSYDIDQDVATATATLTNVYLDPDYSQWAEDSTDFGQPGYYTPDRGTQDNRWGYEPNEWEGVLGRNCLVRSYQGIGGQHLSLEDAVASGHLVLTGVWLADDAPVATGGSFQLRLRGMAKLLVDLQIYPPLVPDRYYPLSYQRYFYPPTHTPIVVYGHLAEDPKYRIMNIEQEPNTLGYWLVGTDGGVFSYGQVNFYGSLGDTITPSNDPGDYPDEGITAMAATPTGRGYWLVNSFGQVYTFGDALYHGGTVQPGAPTNPIIAIERAGSLDGYWLCSDKGEIFAYGAAAHHGDEPTLTGETIVDMASTPTGLGYWMVADDGAVFAFGDADYLGGENTVTLDEPITAIAGTPTGDGYYLVGKDGGVFTHGDAEFRGSVPALGKPVAFPDGILASGSNVVNTVLDEFRSEDVGCTITGQGIPDNTTITAYNGPTQVVMSASATETHSFESGVVVLQVYRPVVLNDPMCDITVAKDGSGYWLAAEDGGVFAFNVPFVGSMPGTFDYYFPTAGNYVDYVDIIRDLALWSGFHLYDDGANAYVYGNLESTGAYASMEDGTALLINATVFDKKPVIDPMHTIKEIVGYLLYVDDEGALHFHEPNFWESGNYLPDGTHTNEIPVVDERVNLTQYERSTPDTDIRSEIIISSNDPRPDTGGTAIPGTVTTSYVPALASELRGMVKPAMWINQVFTSESEQQIMAQLVALHIGFRSRLGTVSMAANPMIQINDQIQIIERETFELNTHYVRAINTTHDKKTGSFISNVTTHFLSPPGSWIIEKPDGSAEGSIFVARPEED